MARISIDLKGLSSANQLLRSAQSDLTEVERELSSVRRSLPAALRSRYNIGNNLSRLLSDISALHSQVIQLLQVSETAISSYRTAEHHLSFNAPDDK